MNAKNLLRAKCLVLAIGSAPVCAAEPTRLASLADLSLEQLSAITVMSASRRDEPLVEAPASIYVITQDDIRRSGATTIPEALRLAPNLHVARADANQYAISARGFTNTLANKLLVLVDGRTAYTPLFSGVFWESLEVFLPDIQRIEVISGPGATLWGANAVNGVISIITTSAAAAQGTLAYAGGGNFEREAGVRHGGELPNAGHYRFWLKYSDRDSARTLEGNEIGDDTRRVSGGARADWSDSRGALSLHLNAYHGEIEQGPMRDYSGASLRGKLSRNIGPDSTFTVQGYYERSERRHERSFDETLDTLDIDLQHAFRPAPAHMLIWGGGYRYARDDVANSVAQAFVPPERTLRWVNAFVQDEIELTSTLSATLAIKGESNPYTGLEWLPNARLSWKVSRDGFVWGALSRAVRAPSRIDRELFIPGNPPYFLNGSDVFESEVANVAELGYRTQATPAISFAATLFHHDYPNLRSIGLVDGKPAFRNDIEGRVSGIETWGAYRASPTWRLFAGLVVQEVDLKVKAGAIDLGGLAALGLAPERMAQLRSSWSPTERHDFDVMARYVSSLGTAVPSYTAVDMRFAWRPTTALEVSLTLQNAFDSAHYEWQNRGLSERAWFLNLRLKP